MSRRTFTVTPDGVGRRDFSLSVELAVEESIRSHQERSIWIAELIDEPTVAYPTVILTTLPFSDLAGNILDYVPDDVKYLLYDIVTTGDFNALTAVTLQTFTYPDEVYIETIAEAYGYGRATLRLTRGHSCEPGLIYAIAITQWCEKATFNAYAKAHGVSDVIMG